MCLVHAHGGDAFRIKELCMELKQVLNARDIRWVEAGGVYLHLELSCQSGFCI